jgi:hypothetical protein
MNEDNLDHRRKLSREIDNLKSSNSQELWKLLKKCKTREQPNIPIDKLFEFFKTLNEKPDADPINIPLLDPGNVNELNENINMNISKEEILKCIKKLKNNKACGEDLVINEYIKSTTIYPLSIVSRIPVNYSISDYLFPLIIFFCDQE